MHHNLYAHNPAVNKGYVVDDAVELRRLCARYNVKLAFSGHIHAQNIMGPQDMTPTTEIVTSSFCSNDQGYGVVRVHSRHITYVRRNFDMTRYLTDEEKENYTLVHYHKYLKDLQLGSISADMMQSELNQYHEDIELVRAMGNLFGWMNYHFFNGHNHIKASELNKIHASKEYQVLIKHHPEKKNGPIKGRMMVTEGKIPPEMLTKLQSELMNSSNWIVVEGSFDFYNYTVGMIVDLTTGKPLANGWLVPQLGHPGMQPAEKWQEFLIEKVVDAIDEKVRLICRYMFGFQIVVI